MRSKFILIIFLLVFSVSAFSNERLDSASKAYDAGNYIKAAEIYKDVAEKYGTSAALLADMGNAYVKSGDYGKAMLSYERSLRLDPSNRKVKDNINYIQSKVEDNNKAELKGKKLSIKAEDKSFFINLKEYISLRHTSDTWAIWGAISFILFLGCLALYIFTQRVIMRKIGFFGAIILLFICVVTVSFSLIDAHESRKHNVGIITGYKVNLMSEPYTTSKPNPIQLTRGTKMDLLDEETDSKGKSTWYKVRLNSDFVGWLPAEQFELI